MRIAGIVDGILYSFKDQLGWFFGIVGAVFDIRHADDNGGVCHCEMSLFGVTMHLQDSLSLILLLIKLKMRRSASARVNVKILAFLWHSTIIYYYYGMLYNREGTHLGFIFFAKASTPIRKFSPFINRVPYSCRTLVVARSTLSVSHASRRPCRVTMIASGEYLPISSASARHVSTGDGDTRLISR